MEWIIKYTSFLYPIFVIWRNVNGEKKDKIVIDIRGLNQMIVPDLYFILL